MLYSQINYLGSFLPIPDNMLENYNTVIFTFVSGKLNLAKNRFSRDIEMGGLGLFDLKNFLDAQKIAWVKRSKSLDDWRKISLYSKSYGTVFNVRSDDINAQYLPCIKNIVTGYEKFMFSLTKKNENFQEAYLFRNKALTLGIRDNRVLVLSEQIFNADFFNIHKQKIQNLRVRDIFIENNYVVFRITVEAAESR
jgi:hypothetical protein